MLVIVRTPSLALLGALTLALAQPSPEPPAPRHDLHRRHHVALDVPPVDAALWFANRYPRYFTSGEAGLLGWLDRLEPAQRDFVLAMGETLAWAWIEHELARLPTRELDLLDPLVRRAELEVRDETLNQLEINYDNLPDARALALAASSQRPEFVPGVFARLVRGVSNCEGQNHLVALLLAAALAPRGLGVPGVHVTMISASTGHDLIKLSSVVLGQPIYVDAWSNLPPFTLDSTRPRAVPTLAELGEPPAPLAPGLAGRPPVAATVYANSPEAELELISPRDAPTRPVDLEIRAPALDEASLARIEDPWRIYLFARILDVYDDPRAAELYRWLLDHHCPIAGARPAHERVFVCEAALLLRARL